MEGYFTSFTVGSSRSLRGKFLYVKVLLREVKLGVIDYAVISVYEELSRRGK